MRRILVPVDFFGMSDHGVDTAVHLAREMNGELRLVHIRMSMASGRGQPFYFESNSEATAVLETAVSRAWSGGVKASGVVVNADRTQVPKVIVAQAAAWNAGLIVMARRRRRELGVRLLGSTSNSVMRLAQCPVLVARGSFPGKKEITSHVSR